MRIVLFLFALTAAGCATTENASPAKGATTSRAEPGPAAEPTPAAKAEPAPAAKAEPAPAPSSVDEAQAVVEEFIVYLESVLVIMRQKPLDCDVAAQRLAERAPVFRELAVKLNAIKARFQSHPEEQRQVEARMTQAMADFKTRNPDADQVIATASACEKSSAAFAKISPYVMTQKKRADDGDRK